MSPTSYGYVVIVTLTVLAPLVSSGNPTISKANDDNVNLKANSPQYFFANLMKYLDMMHGMSGDDNKRMNNAVKLCIMNLQ